jgi:hypothetical protein
MNDYWVRICRTCDAVDENSLPVHDAGPPVEPAFVGQPGRNRLPEWRCNSCGGSAFRVDSWTEGGAGG